MKPLQWLARTSTPDGSDMALTLRDTEYVILVGGKPLMSSRMHGSEEALAALACADARLRKHPRVLVGGLGMGFTLRATLDLLPPGATVIVAELVPAVVDWNRTHLAPLAGRPLDDPRVQVEMGDVGALLRRERAAFDAILLDVDNGPDGLTRAGNDRLYSREGLKAAKAALRPGGVLAIWSAAPDPAFTNRLRDCGFTVEEMVVRGGPGGKGPRHVIWLATRR